MSPMYDWIRYLPRWQAARRASEWQRVAMRRDVAHALMATFAAMADLRDWWR